MRWIIVMLLILMLGCGGNPTPIKPPVSKTGVLGEPFLYAVSNKVCSLKSGNFPQGLYLSTNPCVIAGVPTQEGTFTVTLTVTGQ